MTHLKHMTIQLLLIRKDPQAYPHTIKTQGYHELENVGTHLFTLKLPQNRQNKKKLNQERSPCSNMEAFQKYSASFLDTNNRKYVWKSQGDSCTSCIAWWWQHHTERPFCCHRYKRNAKGGSNNKDYHQITQLQIRSTGGWIKTQLLEPYNNPSTSPAVPMLLPTVPVTFFLQLQQCRPSIWDIFFLSMFKRTWSVHIRKHQWIANRCCRSKKTSKRQKKPCSYFPKKTLH